MKRRMVILLTFTLVTITLAAAVLYSAFFYFTVYRATHSLDIIVKNFNVTILNSTYASATTALIIDNPSEHAFEAVYVQERLTYDSWGTDSPFILTETTWPRTPWQIQPSSNITLTIDSGVSSRKIQPSRPVFVQITVHLRGPLVGGFLLTSYEVFPS